VWPDGRNGEELPNQGLTALLTLVGGRRAGQQLRPESGCQSVRRKGGTLPQLCYVIALNLLPEGLSSKKNNWRVWQTRPTETQKTSSKSVEKEGIKGRTMPEALGNSSQRRQKPMAQVGKKSKSCA